MILFLDYQAGRLGIKATLINKDNSFPCGTISYQAMSSLSDSIAEMCSNKDITCIVTNFKPFTESSLENNINQILTTKYSYNKPIKVIWRNKNEVFAKDY